MKGRTDGCARPSVREGRDRWMSLTLVLLRRFSFSSPPPRLNLANGGSGVSGPAVNAMTLFRGTNESVSSAVGAICWCRIIHRQDETSTTRIPNFIKRASANAARRVLVSPSPRKPLVFRRRDGDGTLAVVEVFCEIRSHLDDFSCCTMRRVFKHACTSNPADCGNPLIL